MMSNCIVISINHLSRRLKYNFDIMATSLKKKTHTHIYHINFYVRSRAAQFVFIFLFMKNYAG